MSLFSWFSRRPSSGAEARKAPRSAPPKQGAAQPRPSTPADSPDQMGRKNPRMERRESLYMVVRDAMVRAGVLSAGYKFKVLSLDQFGQQFVVMIDLAREYGASTARLSEIETLITQSAKARFEILVTAVYWRVHDHTAVGVRMRRAADREAAPATNSGTPQTIRAPVMPSGSYEARASAPAPLRSSGPVPLNSSRAPLNSGHAPLHSGHAPLNSASAPLHSARVPMVSVRAPLGAANGGMNGASATNPVVNGASAAHGAKVAPPSSNGHFDPIEEDEVAAFKRALNSAAASNPSRQASAASRPGTTVRSGPITSSPLLQPSGFADTASGFADTEMPAQDSASSDLSTTQYGDLH